MKNWEHVARKTREALKTKIMSNPFDSGFVTSLESFLSRHFPGLKIFRSAGGDKIEVWLPEDPGRTAAEKAVDAAWDTK